MREKGNYFRARNRIWALLAGLGGLIVVPAALSFWTSYYVNFKETSNNGYSDLRAYEFTLSDGELIVLADLPDKNASARLWGDWGPSWRDLMKDGWTYFDGPTYPLKRGEFRWYVFREDDVSTARVLVGCGWWIYDDGYRYTLKIDVNIWVFLALFAASMFFLRPCRSGDLSQQNETIDRCGKCGYDLRASKDRCPECGTPIPLDKTRDRPPPKDLKPPETELPPQEPEPPV